MANPGLTRRRALGLVVVGLTASGCELTTSDPDATAPPREPTSGSTPPPPETTDDPDSALLTAVRGEVEGTLALVTAAGAARSGLVPELAGFRRLHRRHLELLPGEGPAAGGPAVDGGAGRLRALVTARERQLQESLGDAALRAESGALAALLASMSAAVAQRLAVAAGEGAG